MRSGTTVPCVLFKPEGRRFASVLLDFSVIMADATPETRRCAHRVAHHGSSSSNNALHDILSGTAGGIAQGQ